MTLKGKNVLLCITGSIACYKSVDLYRRLKKEGANIKIILSASAGKFISPYIFESFGEEVFDDDAFKNPLSHITLSKFADIILIAPATYNTINKLAAGIADTLITLTVSASPDKPKVLVPAMNPNMFANKILKDNIDKLTKYNFHIVSPETGNAACGDFGEGRFPEIEDIVSDVESIFSEKKFEGKKVLITAGATREYMDPVRFMSNGSSGKMGISLANEAVRQGADVTLIALNIDKGGQYINKKVKIINCVSFSDFKEVLLSEFKECDMLFMAAAVSDYGFKEKSPVKIKKSGNTAANTSGAGAVLNVELVQNEDLLKILSTIKKSGQIIFGFAAETDSLIENGRKKLAEKSLDYIFINDVSKDVIGADENEGFLIQKDGDITRFERQSKRELAGKLFSYLV
ncbi:MAG: bifunctional phosphopantothenoylcysteine decarboxylase/phosphopantothenate--cysteine ligase CoaBC [Deltaproteobacteria bacterium]|nr:bifunctional phosphopantothenoylcysteine decarboxylase/phosphopantothenate--cysteine ligase CoaBC [Deltaproteobacteria bacterium]